MIYGYCSLLHPQMFSLTILCCLELVLTSRPGQHLEVYADFGVHHLNWISSWSIVPFLSSLDMMSFFVGGCSGGVGGDLFLPVASGALSSLVALVSVIDTLLALIESFFPD